MTSPVTMHPGIEENGKKLPLFPKALHCHGRYSDLPPLLPPSHPKDSGSRALKLGFVWFTAAGTVRESHAVPSLRLALRQSVSQGKNRNTTKVIKKTLWHTQKREITDTYQAKTIYRTSEATMFFQHFFDTPQNSP